MQLIIRFCFFMMLTLGILKTEKIFFESKENTIKEIKISGIDKKFVQDFNFLKSKLIGQSIYKIDIIELTEILKKDIRLENIRITSEGLDKLNIMLERKKPKYYIQYKGKIFLTDKNNTIYGELEDEKISSLPFILIKEEKELFSLINTLEKLETYFEENISQIYYRDENCIEILLVDGTIFKTNSIVSKEKYPSGISLYFGLMQNNKIEYIDFRFEDYIVKYVEGRNE